MFSHVTRDPRCVQQVTGVMMLDLIYHVAPCSPSRPWLVLLVSQGLIGLVVDMAITQPDLDLMALLNSGEHERCCVWVRRLSVISHSLTEDRRGGWKHEKRWADDLLPHHTDQTNTQHSQIINYYSILDIFILKSQFYQTFWLHCCLTFIRKYSYCRKT